MEQLLCLKATGYSPCPEWRKDFFGVIEMSFPVDFHGGVVVGKLGLEIFFAISLEFSKFIETFLLWYTWGRGGFFLLSVDFVEFLC
jgi:hypothetical protein